MLLKEFIIHGGNSANIILINDEAIDIESMNSKSDSSSDGEFYDADVTQQVSQIPEQTVKLTDLINQIPPGAGEDGETNLKLQEAQPEIDNASNQKLDAVNVDNISTSSSSKLLSDVSGIDNTERKGKYHKKHAPAPPVNKRKEIPTITATLVLKPGLVRSFENLSDSSKSEVFLTPSPKARRRHTNKIQLPKLLNLPKRFGLWPKESTEIKKRNSWHDMTSNSSTLSKQTSKSDDDFTRWHQAYLSMKERENK